MDRQKYEESLKNISEPVMLSDIRRKMDLRGLMKYAREKRVKVEQLSEEEKELYVKKPGMPCFKNIIF